MTTLELTLGFIVYITIGLWICNKRNWYKEISSYEVVEQLFICLIAIVLMPLNLLIVLIREFVIRKWN